MHKHHLDPMPALLLGYDDVVALRGIILAHITYIRRKSESTQERQEHIEVLQGLYTRLVSVPTTGNAISILMSIAEVAALSGAIKGFCAFVRDKVPVSPDRHRTLQYVERIREVLLQML